MRIIIETFPAYRLTMAFDEISHKRAAAICHPDDEFDEEKGIKIAFHRLMRDLHPGCKVILREQPWLINNYPFLDPVNAKYVIGYLIHLGVLDESYLERIDKAPKANIGKSKFVHYFFDYEDDGLAILENALTHKIAIAKKENLIMI